MAADLTYTLPIIAQGTPSIPTLVSALDLIAGQADTVLVVNLADGSGGGGPSVPPRPSNGFLYPRGDY